MFYDIIFHRLKRFRKNEKKSRCYVLFASSYRALKMLLNDYQDMALLSHDDGLIYKSYML